MREAAGGIGEGSFQHAEAGGKEEAGTRGESQSALLPAGAAYPAVHRGGRVGRSFACAGDVFAGLAVVRHRFQLADRREGERRVAGCRRYRVALDGHDPAFDGAVDYGVVRGSGDVSQDAEEAEDGDPDVCGEEAEAGRL